MCFVLLHIERVAWESVKFIDRRYCMEYVTMVLYSNFQFILLSLSVQYMATTDTGGPSAFIYTVSSTILSITTFSYYTTKWIV
jgi:hypothetical protein